MIDRIVDSAQAVLLVGETETEHVVPIEQLPDGATEGTWLVLSIGNAGEVADIEIDDQASGEMEKRIATKLDQLRQRGSRHKRSGDPGGPHP